MESDLKFLVVTSNECFIDFPIIKYLQEFTEYLPNPIKIEEVTADARPDLVAKYNIKILPTLFLNNEIIFEGTTEKEEFMQHLMNTIIEKQK